MPLYQYLVEFYGELFSRKLLAVCSVNLIIVFMQYKNNSVWSRFNGFPTNILHTAVYNFPRISRVSISHSTLAIILTN